MIAEVTSYLSASHTKNEIEFRLKKRSYGGWTVFVGEYDLGWIVENYDENRKRDGWTLYFAEADTNDGRGRPRGIFETRYEAGSDLISRLFSGALDGYPRRVPVLDRDEWNRNEIVRNAAVEVEDFAWQTGDWDRDERNRR